MKKLKEFWIEPWVKNHEDSFGIARDNAVNCSNKCIKVREVSSERETAIQNMVKLLANRCPFNCYYEGRHTACDESACEILEVLQKVN